MIDLRKNKLNYLFIIISISLLFIGGCSNTKEVTREKGNVIIINDFEFKPQELVVSPGTTVTWNQNDSPIHTIISDTGLFESETLNNGDQFTFTFNDVGEYGYHCGIHPSMRGKVIVE